MQYIITIDQCGIAIRYGDRLKSYSFHNFNPPKDSPLLYTGDALMTYQLQRWQRFLRLALRIMQDVRVIKGNKLVFSKGGVK